MNIDFCLRDLLFYSEIGPSVRLFERSIMVISLIKA